MGGGVSIDLIHELDYLCYLFGLPQRVRLEKGKYSSLEIDSDDLALYQLAYPDKLAQIYLDYFGVSARRICLTLPSALSSSSAERSLPL